ncbi:unnamed protein product [Notodromas monacha]|uniref:UNC93-like protein MFSD11 n=1 Tax=Notodromas monacha TaxID=399045 RepID=A0A7R9BWI4_9CRUS|nr:unnamed protein product [Notodromas monacha]CAG0921941.1 unnamed protein product [Notodromas monacha]
MGKKTIKYGRDPVVLLAAFAHLAAFFLIFLNLPNNSAFGPTSDEAYITSRMWLALLCSYLLGLGDACYNTQLYAIVGSLYSTDSAPAFALYKFAQSVAAAIAFFYSSHVGLHDQLLILTVSCLIGTFTFWLVIWRYEGRTRGYSEIQAEGRLRRD